MTGAASMIGHGEPALGWNGSVSLQSADVQPADGRQHDDDGLRQLCPERRAARSTARSRVIQAYLQRAFGGKSHVTQAQFNTAAQLGGQLNYNLQVLYGLELRRTCCRCCRRRTQLANAGYSNSRSRASVQRRRERRQSDITCYLNKRAASMHQLDCADPEEQDSCSRTQRSGEEESSYQSGLADSVGLINKFNPALNNLLNGPLGKIVGYSGGAGTGGGGFIDGAEKFLNGMADGGMMGGLTSIRRWWCGSACRWNQQQRAVDIQLEGQHGGVRRCEDRLSAGLGKRSASPTSGAPNSPASASTALASRSGRTSRRV